MQAQCPWCSGRFVASRAGRQNCPLCGAVIDLPEPKSAPPPGARHVTMEHKPAGGSGPWEQMTSTYEGASWEPTGGETPEAPPAPQAELAPWERLDEHGIWKGFSRTVVEASLHPTRFFQNLAPHPSRMPAFLFAMVVYGIVSIASALWMELIGGALAENAALLFPFYEPPSEVGIEAWIVSPFVSAFFTAIGIVLFAWFVHFGCWMVRASSQGFTTTFRTTAYASAPAILGILPGVGLITIVWTYVVLIIGIRWTQRTTTGRAVLAVFLPFILLMLLVMIAGIAAVFIFA